MRDFIKDSPINVNETQEWIELIKKFIEIEELKSKLIENEYGQGIELYSNSEALFIEEMLYLVENTTTTLQYIFEGNIYIGLGECNE